MHPKTVTMQSSLDATAALTDQKAKIEQYRAALQHVIASASVENAKVFVDHSTFRMVTSPPPLSAERYRPVRSRIGGRQFAKLS